MSRPFDQRRQRKGHHKAIARAVAFLRKVGFTVLEEPAPPGCFFPGVWCPGGLVIGCDPRVAHVGDLLHDAGHLAVLEPRLRALVQVGDVYGNPAMLTQPEDLDPDLWCGYFGDTDPHPILELDTKALELAASAWSLAALWHLHMARFRVFGVQWVDPHTRAKLPTNAGDVFAASMMENPRHPGVLMLEELGLSVPGKFPLMTRWTVARCLECGGPLERKERGRPPVFCADRCRARHWNKAHPENQKERATRKIRQAFDRLVSPA